MQTKKIFILTLTFFMIAIHTQAQYRGFRSGIALTTFAKTGDLADNDPLSVSITAGVFRAIPLNPSLNLLPELNYSQRARTGESLLPGYSHEIDYSVHYLQLPLQMQYVNTDIVRRSGAQLHLNAGPYMAYAFNDKINPENGSSSDIESLKKEEKHDFGLSMGMGYQRPLGSNYLRLDMKYDLGLAEVANQPDDFRTKALSFTLGYAF